MDEQRKHAVKAMSAAPALVVSTELTHAEMALLLAIIYAPGRSWDDATKARSIRLSELCRLSKLSRSTCKRLVASLQKRGFLRCESARGMVSKYSVWICVDGTPFGARWVHGEPAYPVHGEPGSGFMMNPGGSMVNPGWVHGEPTFKDTKDLQGGGTEREAGEHEASAAVPTEQRNTEHDQAEHIICSKAARPESELDGVGYGEVDGGAYGGESESGAPAERGGSVASRLHEQAPATVAVGVPDVRRSSRDSGSGSVPPDGPRLSGVRGASEDEPARLVEQIRVACAGPVDGAPVGWAELVAQLADCAGMQSVGIQRDLLVMARDGHPLFEAQGLNTSVVRVAAMRAGYASCIESGSATPRALWIVERGCKLAAKNSEATNMRRLEQPAPVRRATASRDRFAGLLEAK